MVECIKTFANDSFMFLKGNFYTILEIYVGTIIIQDENGHGITFDTPDIMYSSDCYTNWFKTIT
jgi:hypothetical protein